MPEVVSINRSTIDSIRFHKQLKRAWLTINAGEETYTLRLGRGPYPMLTANIETTRQWLEALGLAEIEGERFKHGEDREKTATSIVGLALLLGAALGLPVWLAGFILTDTPAILFLVMGFLTLSAIAVGFLFVLRGGHPSSFKQ